MGSLLEKFAGKIDLIYIDPPFATGADFSFTAPIGDGGEEVFKEQSVIEEKAYRDTWGAGVDSFLSMLGQRIALMRELLSETGVIIVHCDWRMSHRVRLLLDESFGMDAFLNSVVWAYGESARGAKAIASQFPRNHDNLICYRVGQRWTFNGDYLKRIYTVEEARKKGFRQDEQGRWFKTAPRGDYTDDSIARLAEEGRIHKTRTGPKSLASDLARPLQRELRVKSRTKPRPMRQSGVSNRDFSLNRTPKQPTQTKNPPWFDNNDRRRTKLRPPAPSDQPHSDKLKRLRAPTSLHAEDNESTSSNIGRPIPRFGTHRAKYNRHHRSHPAGTHTLARKYRACRLTTTGRVNKFLTMVLTRHPCASSGSSKTRNATSILYANVAIA